MAGPNPDHTEPHILHRACHGGCHRGREVNVATTDASVPDTVMTEPIHQALADRGVLPGEHYLDSGYPSADLLVSSLTEYGLRLVTPMLADTSPQARAGKASTAAGSPSMGTPGR